MKIINLSQGSDEWLEWREGGVTATDATVLLGRSPYKTIWRLWAEKTGYARPEDLSANPLVKKGVENEDKARIAFEEKHDDMVLPACVQSDEDPIFRASLDGLNGDWQPVELKCPSESTWNDVCADGTNSKPYQLYYAQVQHQLMVTEASKGWLVFWFEGEIREFEILPDQELIDELKLKSHEFWDQVTNKIEPPKDPERDTFIPKGDQATEWIRLAEEYRFFEDQVQEAKKRLDDLKAKQKPLLENLKDLMGDNFTADYGGLMITRYKVAGKLDYKKILKEEIPALKAEDIEKYRGKDSERCRVTVSESVKPRSVVDEEAVAPLLNMVEEIEISYF